MRFTCTRCGGREMPEPTTEVFQFDVPHPEKYLTAVCFDCIDRRFEATAVDGVEAPQLVVKRQQDTSAGSALNPIPMTNL